ncbi:MAG TPA: N-acetylmuramoyl-L-alanine amidase [Acidobacteriaceae bacterium]
MAPLKIMRYCTRLTLAITLACTLQSTAQPHKKIAAKPPAKPAVKRAPVLSPYEQALAAREVLAKKLQPTRADYDAVLDQFRAIYHSNPADQHAPDSIFAVAELLAEAGSQLPDPKLSQAAVGQYEFLRKGYPTSHYRADCLLAEAAIEANDLHDLATAKDKYTELIKTYPRSEKVPQAQAALTALKRNKSLPQTAAATKPAPIPEPIPNTATPSRNTRAAVSSLPPMPSGAVSANPPATAAATPARPTAPPVNLPPSETAPSAPVTAVLPSFDDVAATRKQPALITGIRHWSTKSYTRVAIDLGDAVKYEAARVPNPDRIYFDLHGAKLSSELAGKTFDVTDDGFLKRIRAAQFSNDVIRVVLDVNDVTEYSAFLLPNPYRLIIDIHGGPSLPVATSPTSRNSPGATVRQPENSPEPAPAKDTNITAAAALQNNPAAAQARTGTAHPSGDVALDAAAEQPSKSGTSARPAPSMNVPNTTSRRTPSNIDVAGLSQHADKVKATSAPTSQPIAATVPQPDLIGKLNAPRPDNAAVTAPSAPSRRNKKSKADVAAPAHAADLTADGQRSLARALGLKIGRVVIDAGHGGHDSGTLGAGGIEEKDVVLDVALRLGKMLQQHLGVEVIYTRSDDTFIPLETRTAIANKAQADLFISIHANSSSDSSARGVETYYLNFTSDPNALEVAARENAVSQSSIYQLSDLVKKITLKDKIDESREFALDVESSLYSGLEKGNTGLKNRGIKKAPFVVLIGANMPSILTEISFVTNPKDASQLRQPDYRERVAESLYKGVAKYANGLSGVRTSTATAQPEPNPHGAQ